MSVLRNSTSVNSRTPQELDEGGDILGKLMKTEEDEPISDITRYVCGTKIYHSACLCISLPLFSLCH